MPRKKSAKELIETAEHNILKHRKKQQVMLVYKLDRFVYWVSLVLLALFNLVACFFLIPFLMFFTGFYLFLMVALFGFVFGFLFNMLIMGIEHLENKHHLIAGMFIPLLAVLDITLILRIVDSINRILIHKVEYNPGEIVIIFVFSFVLPYLFSVVTHRNVLVRPHR